MGFTDNVLGKIKGVISKAQEVSGLKKKLQAENVDTKSPGLTLFHKIFSGASYSEWSDDLRDALTVDGELLKRYADMEDMDDYPELSSALDIWADDATITDAVHGGCIWPYCRNKTIRVILEDFLRNRIRVEEDAWPALRVLDKYGDEYVEWLVNENGVVGWNFLPTATVRRIESNGELIGFVQNDSGRFSSITAEGVRQALKDGKKKLEDGSVIFEPWEITHFRLRSKSVQSKYGTGVLEPARWIWRRLMLMEDASMVRRLQSAARYIFYVDTGELPIDEAMGYVNTVRNDYKKRKIKRQSGVDFRANVASPDEDVFLPTKGGRDSTRVDVLAPPGEPDTELLEYNLGKLFSSIKVPREFLGWEGSASKASLSMISVQFAQSVMRTQKEFINGVMKGARLHLAILGIDPDKVEWGFRMSPPSYIFELAQIEYRNAQADLAARLEPYMDKGWILSHVLGQTDDDSDSILASKDEEQKKTARLGVSIQSDLLRDYPEVMKMNMGILPGMEQQAGFGGQQQDQGGGGGQGQMEWMSKLGKTVMNLTEEMVRLNKKLGSPAIARFNKKLGDTARLIENRGR